MSHSLFSLKGVTIFNAISSYSGLDNSSATSDINLSTSINIFLFICSLSSGTSSRELLVINGAFIKAFSKNNFRNFETKGYVLQNGSYVSDGSYYTKTLAMTYNSENIANVFEKKCN